MAAVSVPLRLAAASLGCAILAGASLPPAARAVGAVPLVLYLPGRCWTAAILPPGTAAGETRVLSAALSLALTVLLGLVLALVGRLDEAGWIAGLLALCLVSCAVALAVRPASPVEGPGVPAPPFGLLRSGAVVLALASAAYAYADASRGALGQRQDTFTDFWIVPQDGLAPSLATAGVRNEEGRDVTYAIDVVARGHVVDRHPPFHLTAGAERTLPIALPSAVFAEPSAPLGREVEGASPRSENVLERDRVELRLFKDGDRTAAYRRVWVALPPPIAPTPEVQAEGVPAGDLSFSGSVATTLRASLIPTPSGATDAPRSGTAPNATPFDPTRPLSQSQAAAWKAPADPDAVQPLRANASPDVMPALRSPRFAPSPKGPAEPPSLASE